MNDSHHDPLIHPADIAPGKVTPGRAPKLIARLMGLLPVAIAFIVVFTAVETLDELYEAVQDGGALRAVDQPLQAWMVAHRQGWLDTVATAYTHVGGKIGMPILASLTVIALSLWWKTRTPLVLMAVATAGSLIMTTTGKELTARARPPLAEAVPPLEHSPSFPSGHTLNAVVVATVIAYLVLLYVRGRTARVLVQVGLVVFAVLMALSRVYLGHHWLTDVTAGAVAGLGWAWAVAFGHWVYVRMRTKDRYPTVRAVAQEHRRHLAEGRSSTDAADPAG